MAGRSISPTTRKPAMARFRHPLSLSVTGLVALCATAAPAHAQSWVENWFDNASYTSPGSFEDQTRGYLTAGGMSGRVDVHNDYLMSLSLPKVKAGCGGIDMFLGGMSFLDPDYLVQKLESILQAAPAVAFQYLLETLDEKMGNIISKMEAATNFLNSIQVNDCRMANRMVQIAKGDDNMSGIIEEMTGYKSIKEGFAKSYQQSREKIQANNNNPTEDLKDALQNCPAEVTDIFRTGSLLAHAATRVGAGEWADVMRARVGDVYMRWDANDKVPLFSAIPACPRQDTESSDDFLTGRVQRRALNIPATAADCSNDGGRGALELARTRMESIATKIGTRGALTADERQFVANVSTLPVYRMLEWGVRQGVQGSVISDTDELVALPAFDAVGMPHAVKPGVEPNDLVIDPCLAAAFARSGTGLHDADEVAVEMDLERARTDGLLQLARNVEARIERRGVDSGGVAIDPVGHCAVCVVVVRIHAGIVAHLVAVPALPHGGCAVLHHIAP